MIELSNPEHSAGILSGLEKLYRSGTLCDLVIEATSIDKPRDVPVHRAVLCSVSNYFQSLLDTGKLDQSRVCLSGM